MRQEVEEESKRTRAKHQVDRHRSQFCKLVEACKRKDLVAIQQLIGAHPELLNHHDKHHRNLLHYTSILVLDRDAPDATPAKSANTAAAAACLDCFRYLLGRCEPKLCTQRDQDGLTVLHLAVISCNVGLVREILAPPAGLERLKLEANYEDHLSTLATVLDKEHHGPLHWAVITNNLECVKILIDSSHSGSEAGIQLVHQPDLNGATPLHYATQTSDYPKYRAQLRQMLKNATQSSQTSSCQPAASSSSTNSSSATPLSSCDSPVGAANNNNNNKQQEEQQTSERNRKKLVRYETTTTMAREAPRGPSSVSFDRPGSCATQRAASGGNLDILQYLVRLPGVKLECRDRDLRTPLLWAASSGNRQAILLLLQSGADPLCQDANKLGPLHCAASHGYTDCLECLLAGNASSSEQSVVNQADNLACTPLFYAVLSGNIDCVELLLDRGARHDWQDVRGRTPAHFAALKGQLNTLKLLESRGANLWLANKQGDLPLHYAIKSGRQQVVAWLLEHSPYERAVNAINNTGRAPIHLALLKATNGPTTMVEFLIGQGANLNQLVKVKEASKTTSTSGAAVQRYETALDMARRLNARDCLELLERNSAKSAAWVLARREQVDANGDLDPQAHATQRRARTNKSLFDVQAEEVGASPIGFETSGSSAEPPHSVSEPSEAAPARLPAARPPPLVESAAPQLSDSTNSSALSQSSLTSVRGARPDGERAHRASTQTNRSAEKQQTGTAAAAANRPFRGGINYHNERINASIKCKLYENCGHQSFPPVSEPNRKRRHDATREHHSAGSLAAAATAGQQEIITNVNVYTTSPNCPHCIDHDHDQDQRASQAGDVASGGRRRSSGATRARHQKQQQHEFSETTSDTSDATSEILYDVDGDDDDGDSDRGQRAYLPAHADEGPASAPEKAASSQQQQQQQQVRYLPPSQAYTQHLPVILSAEEERSTSGDTSNTGRHESESVSPGDVDLAGADQVEATRANEHDLAPRAHRAHARRAQMDDRCDHQVRSPVAEYIRRDQRSVSMGPQRADVRGGWSHQQHDPRARLVDYSQVRAKVDSHRNDSGLSMSHFGDDLAPGLDGTGSSVGRRSKSWSTLDSRNSHPLPTTGGGPPPAQQTSGDYSPSPIGGAGNEDSRSCSRQTIIRTRRLSVDSVELASSVEKSIRKYKRENKLFEELQNLKRSQIRSGRANEALLVKRLVERFRHEIQRDTLMALDGYHGPYTYQAYELYLYDQLGKISQSNRAKLAAAAGARAPHKFTYQEPSGAAVPLGSSRPAAAPPAATPTYDARDFFEEDLKAELELQRVIQRSEIAARHGEGTRAQMTDVVDESQSPDLVIEPSGALEDIRVRNHRASQGEQVGVASDHNDEVERQRPLDDDSAPKVDIHEKLSENEEPIGAHTNRVGFAGSSTATSSRRSSVEVEREKLESLPLRVAADLDQQDDDDDLEQTDLGSLATEKERRQIEAQARELTAAIITDALGNVSRASSPVGQRTRGFNGDDDDDVDRQQAVELESNSLDGATEDQVVASDAKQQDDTQRAAATSHGRRRSVVNIGNKMEIVYHNVGIEIDTVGENPPSDDESPPAPPAPADDKSTTSGGEVEARTEAADQAAKLEKVHEEEVDMPDQGPDVRRESTESQIDDERAQEIQTADISDHPANSAVCEQRIDDDERESESMAHTPSSSIVALEPAELNSSSRLNALDRPSATFSRRASSPPAPQGGFVGSRRTATSRRMSVDSSHQQPSSSTSDMIVVQRKVFNGFDLDSLHAHRRKHLAAREQSGTTEGEVQELPDAPVHTSSKVRTAGNKTPRARFELRLPRSRPPAGPYQVYVPTELIHERWLAVKRHERRSKRMQVDELEHSQAGQQLVQLVVAPYATTTPTCQPISHAKSQPNLNGRAASTGREMARANAECSNFILIYELNKSASEGQAAVARDEEEARRRAQIEQQVNSRWCQRRITKIVDVRALKRTLSLPECLIYSNDLLKRFNILKL